MPIEATGRTWKLGMAAAFVVTLGAVAAMVATGSGLFGWVAAFAIAGLLVSAVRAWLTSG